MKIPKFVERKVKLAPYTSFRVGGEADYYAICNTLSELKETLNFTKDHFLKVFVLGRGTNVLVSDHGFRGIVIKLGKDFSKISVEGREIVAGAGAQLAMIATRAYQNSLSGLEWAAGIPGTLGGALKMNAGAHGFSMSDIVKDVLVLDLNNYDLRRLKRSEIEFGYRKTSLSDSEIILEATLILASGKQEEIRKLMDSMFEERKRKQPVQARSAGSVFKNPDGDYAARLIESCGLKGYSIGGAMVSEKHANFIVNTGNATAADINSLIKKIKEEVYKMFKVNLETEIILVGDFD